MHEEYGYVVNVDGAVVRDGEYLVVERSPDEDHAAGLLAFPGGKVEQEPPGHDTVEETVAREIREEVGVGVETVEYVHSRTFETDGGVPCLYVLTTCEYADGTARVREPDEVAAVHWLAPEEIAARADAPAFLERDVERVVASRATD